MSRRTRLLFLYPPPPPFMSCCGLIKGEWWVEEHFGSSRLGPAAFSLRTNVADPSPMIRFYCVFARHHIVPRQAPPHPVRALGCCVCCPTFVLLAVAFGSRAAGGDPYGHMLHILGLFIHQLCIRTPQYHSSLIGDKKEKKTIQTTMEQQQEQRQDHLNWRL